MAEVGVMAYPIVLATMYGVSRVGRNERWGSFEWMRLGALALLLGLVVSVQVKFIMLGVVSGPVTIAAALISVGGCCFLIGLYLWDRWLHAGPRGMPRVPQA